MWSRTAPSRRGGRQVRCASCKHSWHQDPEASEAAVEESEVGAPPIAELPIDPGPVAEDEGESLAEATLIEPRSGPEIEERAFEEAAIVGDVDPTPVAEQVAIANPQPTPALRSTL